MSIRELPAELKAVAKRDLGEDEDRLEEHIELIRKWLEKQPHINANTGEILWFSLLATFQRNRKEKTSILSIATSDIIDNEVRRLDIYSDKTLRGMTQALCLSEVFQ